MSTSAEEAYTQGHKAGLNERNNQDLPVISSASGEPVSHKEFDWMNARDLAKQSGLDALLKTLGGEEAARARLGDEKYDALVQELHEMEKK